ncbi:MAG: AAA family ATPase [Actinobacteria bacterium]|nr:AAA family ATPase [Actinomycetota bacterium]
MHSEAIPTVLVTGTVGSGKTSVADEIAVLLHEQSLSYALLDLDWLCQAYPAPEHDPYRDEFMFKNLAAMWPNYRAEGVHYLVLARVIEDRDHLDRYREAIPEADITVVGVVAPPEVIQRRLRNREIGSFYDHLWRRSQELSPILGEAAVEDFTVSNDERPVREVAVEILTRLGWPTP